jgi:hypothetical protein
MVDLPDPQSSEVIADWVELHLALGNKHMSRAEVSSAVEAASGSEPGDPLLSDVWRELSRREALYRPALFTVKGLGVRASGHKRKLIAASYKACLLLSLFGDPGHTMAKLFERITRCAVERYLGGSATIFGWEGVGDIGARVKQLADSIGEQFVLTPRSRYKDRGVDVVGWKPFDNRSGQVVILTQCAAGFNWVRKSPVPHRAWEQYIHWSAPPNIGLAIPSIVPPDDWHDRCLEMGVLFDRPRLINLVSEGCDDPTLTKELSDWIADQI